MCGLGGDASLKTEAKHLESELACLSHLLDFSEKFVPRAKDKVEKLTPK